jgi:hypothetical protein
MPAIVEPVTDPPPYDLQTVRAQPYAERLRLVCQTWVHQVHATPAAIMLAYVLKIALIYVGGWWFFCSFTPGMGAPSSIGSWAFTAIAFQKAVLWSLTYEGLGLGCSTGPMTGRFLPPIGGVLHFVRPGTTKLPVFPGLPVIGGTRRTRLDVLLYVATYALLLRALLAPEITPAMLLPIVALLPIVGCSDQTVFLATRGEHYYTAVVCLAAVSMPGGVWIAGCKVVWVAIWMWAATSKLNSHFPTVIAVMLTNSPFVPAALYEKLYRAFPDDLRPSSLASAIAHFGTLVEYTFPIVLLLSGGGPLTVPALVAMFFFHSFIAGNFPMGMPVEWNVMMVYGGIVLFGFFGEVPVAALAAAPALALFLFVMVFLIPLYGNFVPSRVSFLMAMRYYAGNWAYSVWLFRGASARKLDRVDKAVPLLRDQLARILDDPEAVEWPIEMQPSFRLMHLQGRALHDALPHAVDDLSRYEWMDGEMVAGMVLGWNFGDGHLHDEQLLAAIQERCDFEPGELRVVFVESQPLFGATMAWRIADAAGGPIARGESRIAEMKQRQPWPDWPLSREGVPSGEPRRAAGESANGNDRHDE